MLLGSLALAATPEPPKVDVRVLAPASVARAGQAHVAVEVAVPDGWHIYWENPGQSGLATEVHWTATGGTVSAPLWPVPERFEADGLVNYGYAGRGALVFTVRPTTDVITLTGEVRWLACREICVPGTQAISARIPVSAAAPEPPALSEWVARLPRPFAESGGRAEFKAGILSFTLPMPVDVFPSTALEPAWTPTITPDGAGVSVRGPLTGTPDGAFLVLVHGHGAERRGWTVSIPLEVR